MSTIIEAPPPVVSAGGSGGGGSGWVELTVAKHDIDAHLLAGRLEEAGIEVSMVKDKTSPAWLFGGSNPRAPVTLLVRRFQLESARLALAEIAFEAPAATPVSSPAEAPRRARLWPILWWAAALALGAFFSTIGLAQTARSLHGCKVPVICSNDR